ncbi:MAG: SDR family oxidoreductase [Comamonadaceae bacterium]|nr:MAG: SDR family oxidoreductase [Comamonadaceae bacterium]
MGESRPVCLITGSSTGIGAACARSFARQGWNVALSFLDDATRVEGEAVLEDCTATGADATLQPLDVRDNTSCVRFTHSAQKRWGRIDALINCAAVTHFIAHANLSVLDGDEFHRTYDVNVVGAYQMMRAAIEPLRASGRGSIINVSSIGGLIGRGSSMAYAASKGALNTLTLSMARAMAPHVRVNAIAPGMVDGGLPSRVLDATHHAEAIAAQTAASVLKRVSQPEEVAALAWFLTTQAPGMTGEVVVMDNGLHLNAG